MWCSGIEFIHPQQHDGRPTAEIAPQERAPVLDKIVGAAPDHLVDKIAFESDFRLETNPVLSHFQRGDGRRVLQGKRLHR